MATTMHFGPEWMRNKQPPGRTQTVPSPPPLTVSNNPPIPGGTNGTPTLPSISSYSALVSPAPVSSRVDTDIAHPFKYSKAEMLRIWKDIGGKTSLPIEVEKWEGVVTDENIEPIGVKEMTELEKKIFASSINSELRRRQSSDYLVQGDRPKLHHLGGGTGGPLREGFSSATARRRRGDSNGTDLPPLTLNRKQSWTSSQGGMASPSLASPRTRLGGSSHGSGFDGVLNSGDAWIGSRRRLSAAGSHPIREVDIGIKIQEKEPEIKEEEEEKGTVTKNTTENDTTNFTSSTEINLPDTKYVAAEVVGNAVKELSLDTKPTNPEDSNDHSVVTVPKENTADFASILWSYLDPSGNVQGPFPADTMQSWFDQQYFTDDLRMKRTNIDADWMTVGELKRRALGEKIYLSALSEIPAQPPGLTRRPRGTSLNPGLQGSIQNTNVFETPYQPSPLYTSRSATLDSYLGVGQSESPILTIGNVGFGRPPISDEVMRTTSRATSFELHADPQFNTLPSSNNFLPEAGNSFLPRRTFTDGPMEHVSLNRSFYGDRSTVVDPPNFGNASAPHIPWQNATANDVPYLDSPKQNILDYSSSAMAFNAAPNFSEAQYDHLSQINRANSFNNVRAPSREGSIGGGSQSSGLFGNVPLGYGAVGSNTVHSDHPRTLNRDHFSLGPSFEKDLHNGLIHSPALSLAGAQHQPSLPHLTTTLDSQIGHQPTVLSPISPSIQHRSSQSQILPLSSALQSPWGGSQTQISARVRPFDPPHPTIKNTFDIRSTSPQPRAWAGIKTGSGRTDGWGDFVDESHSLTFNHVNQHNELTQGLGDDVPTNEFASTEISVQPTESQTPSTELLMTSDSTTATTSAIVVPEIVSVARPVKNRPSISTSQQTPQSVSPVVSSFAVSSSPTILTPSKSVWSAVEDDSKKSKTAGTIGLREIQEAEKKKQEARKVAEREKEKLARAAAAAASLQAPESQTLVASWGLPTSQAGVRINNNNNINGIVKDTTVGVSLSQSPPTITTPAWTTTTKPAKAKKTMKEIQEEEEKRKLLAASQKETVASAAKRAYADSATKLIAVPSATITGGGSWSTVGAGGKVQQPPSTVRPLTASTTVAPSVSSTTIRSVNVNGSSSRPSTDPQVGKLSTQGFKVSASAAAPAEEEPKTPSPEFLKWLRESLRGLNSSVQFEEIAQMLLSFPLDPDVSSVELISEAVYGASTILDGRRFAAEFIAKRKADANAQMLGKYGSDGSSNSSSRFGTMTSGGGGTSLADVVKTQPKPAQTEWGYKVVKKKGKGGGRS